MPHRSFVAPSACPSTLQPAPINPEWILEGEPVARSSEWTRGTDGTTVGMIWDCTAGSFRWYFGGDEIVHIVEGEVIVEADDVPARTLRPGDVAIFHAGTWATWTVPTYVRKNAIWRYPLPAAVAVPMELTRKLFDMAERLRRRMMPRRQAA